MNPSITPSLRLAVIKRFAVIMLLCWTAVVGASLVWNLINERLHTLEVARKEALATFNKDQAFRFWATKHGGVYVPATDETPPNPYLSHVPDRDMTLPSGKKLTLMNPAYALRQLMRDFEQEYGVTGHITSLKPLNPANAPDEWERAALHKFESGALEVSETITIEGKPYLRFIRPMIAKKGCLKCHARQGYKEGDIRGAVGISFPLDPFLDIERDTIKILLATHSGIWLLGLGSIGFVYSRSKKNVIERVRTEEEARENRERFSDLVEATSDFVWETDADHAFTYASPRIKDILGYESGEVVGRSAFDLIPPDETDRLIRALKAATRSHENFLFFENINVHKDGHRVLLEDSGVPFFDASGAFLGYRGMSRDITERKRVEAELRASEQNLALHVMQTPLGVIEWDLDFKVNKWNPAAERIFGYSRSEAMGSRASFIVPAAAKEHVDKIWSELIQQKGGLRSTNENVTKDGRSIYCEWYNTPLVDANGNVISVASLVQDVTERRRAEEALHALNEGLEQRVSSRTAELEQKNCELEKLNKLFVGRELRMIELKQKINELKKITGA